LILQGLLSKVFYINSQQSAIFYNNPAIHNNRINISVIKIIKIYAKILYPDIIFGVAGSIITRSMIADGLYGTGFKILPLEVLIGTSNQYFLI